MVDENQIQTSTARGRVSLPTLNMSSKAQKLDDKKNSSKTKAESNDEFELAEPTTTSILHLIDSAIESNQNIARDALPGLKAQKEQNTIALIKLKARINRESGTESIDNKTALKLIKLYNQQDAQAGVIAASEDTKNEEIIANRNPVENVGAALVGAGTGVLNTGKGIVNLADNITKMLPTNIAAASVVEGVTGLIQGKGFAGFETGFKKGTEETVQAYQNTFNTGAGLVKAGWNLSLTGQVINGFSQWQHTFDDWKKLSDQGKLNWQTAARSQANRASENPSNQTGIALIDGLTGIPSVIESNGDPEKIGAAAFNLGKYSGTFSKAKIPTAPEFKAGQVWNSQTGEVLGAKKIPTDLKTGTNPSAGKTSVTIDVPHAVVADDIPIILSANKPAPTTSTPKLSLTNETQPTVAKNNMVPANRLKEIQARNARQKEILEIEAKKKSGTATKEDIARYQNLLAEQVAADLQEFGTSLGLPNGLAKDLGRTAKEITKQETTNPKKIAGVQASLNAVTPASFSNFSSSSISARPITETTHPIEKQNVAKTTIDPALRAEILAWFDRIVSKTFSEARKLQYTQDLKTYPQMEEFLITYFSDWSKSSIERDMTVFQRQYANDNDLWNKSKKELLDARIQLIEEYNHEHPEKVFNGHPALFPVDLDAYYTIRDSKTGEERQMHDSLAILPISDDINQKLDVLNQLESRINTFTVMAAGKVDEKPRILNEYKSREVVSQNNSQQLAHPSKPLTNSDNQNLGTKNYDSVLARRFPFRSAQSSTIKGETTFLPDKQLVQFYQQEAQEKFPEIAKYIQENSSWKVELARFQACFEPQSQKGIEWLQSIKAWRMPMENLNIEIESRKSQLKNSSSVPIQAKNELKWLESVHEFRSLSVSLIDGKPLFNNENLIKLSKVIQNSRWRTTTKGKLSIHGKTYPYSRKLDKLLTKVQEEENIKLNNENIKLHNQVEQYFQKIIRDNSASPQLKEIARETLDYMEQVKRESKEAYEKFQQKMEQVFQKSKDTGVEKIKLLQDEIKALEATQYLDAPYKKAIEMQKPTVQVAQDIPDEFMRPRKPIDKAFNLMEQLFNPDNFYPFHRQTKYNSVEEWESVRVTEKTLKLSMKKLQEDAQKARLEAETIDLSIYQGMQRQHKFQEIKQEVQTLLSELPANPRPTDLVEWIHKKYPELQIRMPSRADLEEKYFMSGIPKNTGYYTETQKTLPNMVFFIPPGSMQASIRGQQIIQKSSLPNQAKMIQHRIDGTEAAYKSMSIDPNLPAMILTKESSFTAFLHEFMHFLQFKKGLVSSEIQQTFAPLESVRANAKQKILQGLPLDWNEKNLLKEEALAEVEVGQIIAQTLKGHIPDEDFAFQHPYTDLWMQVLKDK